MRMLLIPLLVALAIPGLAPAASEPPAPPPGEPSHEHLHGEGAHGPGAAVDREDPALRSATSMTRQPAGTSWQPDESPHEGIHVMRGDWMVNAHYLLFGGYGVQNGPRGDSGKEGIGWGMLMASRRFAPGTFGARIMLSPEPATTGGRGYPLLLQTGEMYDGERLHDRQHPHDLFMEIAATWTGRIRPGAAWQIYAAPVGEPALGPLAAPHRVSAAFDPLAPLGHHWIDSTHISFGVVTAGVSSRRLRIEASRFNGREPDDERWDFDFRGLDSYAVRFSVNPTPRLSGQVSYGSIESHDALEPEEPLRRITASAMYHRATSRGHWASTIAFGRNLGSHAGDTDAFLLESTFASAAGNAFFGRAERVEKTDHDLVLDPSFHGETFVIGSLTLGYHRRVGEWGGMTLGVGARGTVNFIHDRLAGEYGSSAPRGGMIFLRMAPRSTGPAH